MKSQNPTITVARLATAFVVVLALIMYGTTAFENRPTGITVGNIELTKRELDLTISELQGMIVQAKEEVSLGGSNLVATTPLSKKAKEFYLELSSERLNSSLSHSTGRNPLYGPFETAEKRRIGREAAEEQLGVPTQQADRKLAVYAEFLSFLMETFSLNSAPELAGMVRTQEVRDTLNDLLIAYRQLLDLMDKAQPKVDSKSQYIFRDPADAQEEKAIQKKIDDASRAVFSAQIAAEQHKEEPLSVLLELLESY